jgi:hypothetical protein
MITSSGSKTLVKQKGNFESCSRDERGNAAATVTGDADTVRAVPFTGVKHGYCFRNGGRGIGYHANEKRATAEADSL